MQQAGDVWWDELASLSDPALLPVAVARALGVSLDKVADPTQAVLAALRGRAALLVLDNAEHLLDGVTAFIAAVRDGAAQVKLLVTARRCSTRWTNRSSALNPWRCRRAMTWLARARVAQWRCLRRERAALIPASNSVRTIAPRWSTSVADLMAFHWRSNWRLRACRYWA